MACLRTMYPMSPSQVHVGPSFQEEAYVYARPQIDYVRNTCLQLALCFPSTGSELRLT